MNSALLTADLRDAFRRMRASPGYFATILLVFAVGLGSTTAVFSVVRSELLRPLPFSNPKRLVALFETSPAEHNDRYEVSQPNLEDWLAVDHDFDSAAFYLEDESTLTQGDRARRLETAQVSPAFFRTLGVRPEAGPGFAGSRGDAVLVSHRLWKDELGGRADIVGTALRLGGGVKTVVGVMPEGFDFPSPTTELWTPFVVEPWMRNRAVHILHPVVRLKPGVTVARASADLAAVARSVQSRNAGADPGHGAVARALRGAIVGTVRPALVAFAAAVSAVWLIACADLAAMLLSRAERRRREIGIRRSLGAGRARLATGMAVEGVLIGGLGGLAAYAAFLLSARAIAVLLPPGLPRTPDVAGGPAMLLFSLAAGIASGLALSIAPAALLIGGASALLGARDADAVPRSRRRLADALVVSQMALSMMLLTGAALLARSFLRLASVDPGFREERLLTIPLDVAAARWRERSQLRAFAADLQERVAAVPGVVSASATSRLPVSGGDSAGTLTVEGEVGRGAPSSASFRRILPAYFRTMGIPMLRGRDFDAHDDGRRMVVIVNASLAARYWPGADPIGRRIKVGPAEREPWLTVVGVSGDVRNAGLEEGAGFATYEPFTQRPGTTMVLVVRARGADEGIAAAVADAVRGIDRRIAVYDAAWMTDRIHRSLAPRRTYTLTTGFFAGVTVLLAAIGLFGLLSSAVAARTREIGVRIAVGARAGDIRRLVLRWGGMHLAAGIAVGVPLSLAAAAIVAARVPGALFRVSATDGETFAAVVAILAIVGVAAAILPARRAARVDPIEALRSE